MTMYRILLTFLVIIFACSIAEALGDKVTEQKVDKICKQTKDSKFCRRVFIKTLNTSSPSNKDLMNVTLREAERFSANTHFFISTLLRNAGDERQNLQMCAEAYSIVNIASTNAVSFFLQGLYGKIIKLQDKVSSAIDICKTEFNVPGYKINPLIEKNIETRILMSMVKIVYHLS